MPISGGDRMEVLALIHPMDPMTLKPDVRDWFVTCVEAIDEPNLDGDYHCGWIEHFSLADSLGVSRRWTEAQFIKFNRWGWFEERNNCDAWLLPKGVDVYRQIKKESP